MLSLSSVRTCSSHVPSVLVAYVHHETYRTPLAALNVLVFFLRAPIPGVKRHTMCVQFKPACAHCETKRIRLISCGAVAPEMVLYCRLRVISIIPIQLPPPEAKHSSKVAKLYHMGKYAAVYLPHMLLCFLSRCSCSPCLPKKCTVPYVKDVLLTPAFVVYLVFQVHLYS